MCQAAQHRREIMPYVEWKNEYSVGVKAFNDDHKRLFSYLNELHDGLNAGFKVAEMEYILKGLVDYTTSHFQREERLMVKHNYPDYKVHKDEHEALLKEVGEFYADFKAGKKAFSFALLEFLNSWISNHILQRDMMYKEFFVSIAEAQKE